MSSNLFNKVTRRMVSGLSKRGLISSRTTSRWLYKLAIGHFPDLEHPRDFNEKILYLSLNGATKGLGSLADKYEVRQYVSRRAGDSILIPLLQVSDRPEEIDFEKLDAPYIIKTTDGFSRAMIVRDKSDIDIGLVKKTLRKWMKERRMNDEPHYLEIKRRLIAERLLMDKNGNLPRDYKFFCINGEPVICMVCSCRDINTLKSKFSLYRIPNWEKIDGIKCGGYEGVIDKPACLDEMIDVSRRLSSGLRQVRVDLYELEGKVYFGEMTLTAAAGRQTRFKQSILDELGAMIDIEAPEKH